MATLTRLLVLLHMRKSARAGAAAQSAAPSVESASSRPAILFMSMGQGAFVRHIRRARSAVNLVLREVLSDWRGISPILAMALAYLRSLCDLSMEHQARDAARRARTNRG